MKRKFLKLFFIFLLTSLLVGSIGLFLIINYYSRGLPKHDQLSQYDPDITTRLYATDGKLLKEYAKEKRLFLPIDYIPELVKNAFIAAEDANFYNHAGVDFHSLGSAMIYNIGAYFNNKPLHGASTITQQVVKNFLLNKDRTIERKIKEAILAFRINQSFKKDRILELYLNQIYLGNRSYGVAAAALNYFNKSIDKLTLEEVAILAALPKAPGNLNPVKNYNRAFQRRNWVIKRMRQEKFITKKQAKEAREQPIILRKRNKTKTASAEYFAEEVRKELVKMYSKEEILTSGMVISTTLDPRLQEISQKYLQKGIEDYDMKHGFRGPIGYLITENFYTTWPKNLLSFNVSTEHNSKWIKAVVLNIDDENNKIDIGLTPTKYTTPKTKETKQQEKSIDPEEEQEIQPITIDNKQYTINTGYIPLKHLTWARTFVNIDETDKEIEKPSDVYLKKGDVILVGSTNLKEEYKLRQIPKANGAVLIMDPHTGRILSLVGGYLDSNTAFNRATQAKRQPGSVLKTFAYLAALENGFTPTTIIMDEEIELDQGQGKPPYKPKNHSEKFYGPTPLRIGLEKSRNVTTVRLASEIGLDKVTEVIKRFGINEHPRKIYSIVLGSTETNLLKLTRAYAMIINGGKIITPSLIERIQDKNGHTLYRRDTRQCKGCSLDSSQLKTNEIIFPEIPDTRETITDSATAYQITSLLEGVVLRGTGWRAKYIGKPIGGKTGTTNNSIDAWFVGFTPDLVVSTYVGYDNPQSLGKGETGSSAAAPIFVNIMKEALKDKLSLPFRIPPTVKLVKIDRTTGLPPTPVTNPGDIIFEAFKINNETENINSNENIETEIDDINEEYFLEENANNEYENLIKIQKLENTKNKTEEIDIFEEGVY